MQARNFLLFIVCVILVLVGWPLLEQRFWPRPQPAEQKKTAESEKPKENEAPKPPENEPPKPKAAPGAGFWADVGSEIKRAVANQRTPLEQLISLGSKEPLSPYLLHVLLDPKGAAVSEVLLNRFKEGDSLGRPTPFPLLLVRPDEYSGLGSFQLFHYDNASAADEKPLETLGQVVWKTVANEPEATVQTSAGARKRKSVSFQTAIKGVRITKTYSLTEGDYHLGLEVRLARADGADKPVKFRYQLAGGRGLPVEGKWYTSIFRNALIGRVDNNSVWRDLQDLRQISIWQGGKPIGKEKSYIIRYAAVAVQYFASAIVVDDDQPEQDFIARARPTLEKLVLKGRVKKSVSPGEETFVLETDDHKDEIIHVTRETGIAAALVEGQRRAVLAIRDSHEHTVALEIEDEAKSLPALWQDDITVRVTTEAFEVRPGSEVVQKYLLYNGPVKPSLLAMPGENTGVPAEVVSRYVDKLKLNSMVDYQSQSWIGNFSSAIYWTDLIIWFTNVMHRILSLIHWLVPNYGLCIICLTILVRGMMFPISRKQALMSLRMQELAPEMKKVQEKYKNDRQAAGVATMELYRKHGVNPLGTCWFLVLQMPVFMGLYFALQESIYFRLAGAWPLWIHNLAAPDMLWEWGWSVPWISQPQSYGGFLYLGPYLNLLPICAVALMIMQQKMMTPPPQDEQQAMQQKMMKYMMVFFGIMFYKVAAGLCIYFIASSVWGFCERKLLPKKKLNVGKVSADAALASALASGSSGSSSSAVTAGASNKVTGSIDGRGRRQGRNRRNQDGEHSRTETEPLSNSAWSRFRRRVSDWWTDVLKKAEKK